MKIKILFLILVISYSLQSQADCTNIYKVAYNLQIDRQNGIQTEQDHRTQLLHDLHISVWQMPQYFSKKYKEEAAERFARDWKEACKYY